MFALTGVDRLLCRSARQTIDRQQEVGLGWQINSRFHVAALPVSLPIFFNDGGVALSYRIVVTGGIDF